jgi:hypothetical protein
MDQNAGQTYRGIDSGKEQKPEEWGVIISTHFFDGGMSISAVLIPAERRRSRLSGHTGITGTVAESTANGPNV